MRLLLTAAEAYPEFERAFLSARTEIWGSFLVFDLSTRLRSAEARRIGSTWFDLVTHTLQRGVRITMAISDFDPIARPLLHQGTWRSVRMFVAAAELADAADRLRVIPARHPAEAGILPRMFFAPLALRRLAKINGGLRKISSHERRARLRDMPGITALLQSDPGERFRPKLWPPPRLSPAIHHQKLAVVDRSALYIGGLDLNERRYDTPRHDRPGEETWHDIQLLVTGPVVAEAQRHLETFLDVVAGRQQPEPQRYFLRTLSRRRSIGLPFIGPEPLVQEIALAHEELAARAQHLIYLETQFFRDRRMARRLAGIAASRPGLGMILVVPGAPEDVAFEGNQGIDARFGEMLQARCLRILLRGFGRRLFVASPAQPRRSAGADEAGNDRDTLKDAPLVYVHAKASFFDDSAAIISSANMNGRSLRWDSEAGVLIDAPDTVASLRRRVMAHLLPADAPDDYFDLEKAVDLWRDLALGNARLPPEARRGFLLPHDIRATERFGRPAPGLPEELV